MGSKAARDSGFDKLNDARNRSLGIVCFDKIEVALGFGLSKIGHDTLIDAVCIHDDLASGRLAKNLGQSHNGDGSARDDIGQYLARTNRWQLIDVANHQQG